MKRRRDCRRQILTLGLSFESQIVPRTLYRQQFRFRWNELECRFHLLNRSERIARPLDEQGWRFQFGEMLSAQLSWLAWRVKRIGE